MRYSFAITPVGKPRMTRQDQWRSDPYHKNPLKRQRKAVTQYWQYKADLEKLCLVNKFALKETIDVIFFLPMPDSWSNKKKILMLGQPHQQVPDGDNLLKGFLDALTTQDCQIWDKRVRKFWGESGEIIVLEDEKLEFPSLS
jgi:Holliday junction resolvase RusA-like endonuclease